MQDIIKWIKQTVEVKCVTFCIKTGKDKGEGLGKGKGEVHPVTCCEGIEGK